MILPFVSHSRLASGSYHTLAIAAPAVSLLSLNIFSKMALGALSGFEYVAILAGETRVPVRNVGLSVMIAAPVIALMFILGTSSVLAFVQNSKIDLIGPAPQVLSLGFGSFRFVSVIVSVSILMLLGRSIALVSIYFIGNTRLPMVAGWDNLLPVWFARLHQKYKTPVNAIMFVGIVTLAFALASLIGVGAQEAFQLLENAAGVFYAIAYMIMFAIPIFGLKALGVRPPVWLKLAAACGFLVSLLYAVLTIFPIVDVVSWFSFAMKIIVVTIAANGIGAGIFAAGKSRGMRTSLKKG